QGGALRRVLLASQDDARHAGKACRRLVLLPRDDVDRLRRQAAELKVTRHMKMRIARGGYHAEFIGSESGDGRIHGLVAGILCGRAGERPYRLLGADEVEEDAGDLTPVVREREAD